MNLRPDWNDYDGDFESGEINLSKKSNITAFHTLDPMQGNGIEKFIEALESKTESKLDKFFKLHPEILEKLENEGYDKGDETNQWDSATTLFVAYRAVQGDGAPAEPLDRGISMERIGRFPSKDGNAISYLRQYHLPEKDDSTLSELLEQLDVGLRAETRGDERLSEGFGGLILHGWLIAEQVRELRLLLQKSAWTVASDETFDGGVREIVRHLLILLKSAEKRNLGILMRSHE